MTGPTHRPAVFSRNLSLAYGALLVVACAVGSEWALLTALAGLAALGLGLGLGTGLLVSFGFALFGLAAVLREAGDGSVEGILLVVLLAALAWDAGQRAIDLGDQLGREAGTRRLEYLRAGNSALVGATATAVGYGVFSIAGESGQFTDAVVLLVIATGGTLWATR